jgi:tetratricopeptide (TPR) repeat protein
VEALIAFSWHRCDTKPSLEIATHSVTEANASGVEEYIASAVWCLGRSYFHLGDHLHSYNLLKEAYQLFNTIPLGKVESQRLGGQCGIDLVEVMCVTSEDTGKVASLAREVEMKCAALSDDLVHGRSLMALGMALDDDQQPQEALVYLECAIAKLKVVGNSANLGEAYQAIALVQYYKWKLPEALDAIQEAWKLHEPSASPNQQADSSLTFGVILFSANRDTEAWKYIEIALMKASYSGNRIVVARALEYMGYGYLRRGDYQNAYGAYQAATEKYSGTTIASQCEERCKGNMAGIKLKQGNADVDVLFLRPDSDPYSEFPFRSLVQPSASDVPISWRVTSCPV